MAKETRISKREKKSKSKSLITSPFLKRKLRFSVALHPSQLDDPKTTLNKQLRKHLLQHIDAAGGVLLAVRCLSVPVTKNAHILDDHPAILYPNVIAEALIWSPLSHRVKGRVQNIFTSHCTVLVLGYFSASIMPEEGLVYYDNNECIEQSTGRQVGVGSWVEMTCERVYESNGIISLVGTNAKLTETNQSKPR